MGVTYPTIVMMRDSAGFAMDSLRMKVTGSIDGYQQGVRIRAKRLNSPLFLQILKGVVKYRSEIPRLNGIQDIADLIVGWNIVYTKQVCGIIYSARLLHQPLKRQKRRALAEKDRESGHRYIAQTVVLILSFPWIGKLINGGGEKR
jgi:hypothetical protein